MSYGRLTYKDKSLPRMGGDGKLVKAYSDYSIREIINRLSELEDKIENDTLIELPCEVNDTIYVVFSQFKSEISKCRVDEITITDRGIYVVVDIYYPRYVAERATSFPISWFDKFVFFTKEDAEQKMKEFMHG